MPERIQRRRTKGWRKPPNTVCISWPSIWGNYWRPSWGHDNAESVRLFRQWLEGKRSRKVLTELYGSLPIDAVEALTERRRRLLGNLYKLHGKNLACWCPIISHDRYTPCHADVLLSIANGIPMEEVIRENTRRAKGQAVR